MDLLRRWRRQPPEGVYALYDGGERVGPLPVIYSHYHRGYHHWEVLIPYEHALQIRGMHIDALPSRTMLTGTLSDGIESHQWNDGD